MAGEYRVASVETVLDDGLPVSHVRLEAVTDVKGVLIDATVIFPGGVVDGRFRDWFRSHLQVVEGETLFLMLKPVSSMPGYFTVRYSFLHGFFRRVTTERGSMMVDAAGRFIVDMPCDGLPARTALLASQAEGEARAPSLPDVIWTDDPEAVAMPWDDAVAALVQCGGVE
jgi:hypothetical protein